MVYLPAAQAMMLTSCSAQVRVLMTPVPAQTDMHDELTLRSRQHAATQRNSLPNHVRNAPTLVAFRQELKTMLFRECFPVD